MVSDGVADFTREGQEDWLTTVLSALPAASARRTAKSVLDAALHREDPASGDDMTVLCARAEAWK